MLRMHRQSDIGRVLIHVVSSRRFIGELEGRMFLSFTEALSTGHYLAGGLSGSQSV